MKDLEKIKDMLIDDFYNEEYEKTEKGETKDCELMGFNAKLESLERKLDFMESEACNFDINTLDIIDKAEAINEKRKSAKETILFSVVSAAILFLYSIVVLRYGVKVFAISQGVVVTLIPWIVIPIAIHSRKGSEM